MNQPQLKLNPPTKDIQRFLMHLVTHLASVYMENNISLQVWSEKWTDILQHDSKETFGAGIFNIASYFNHSCMPNAILLTTTDAVIVKTVKPIKAGQQIFIRYGINPHWTAQLRKSYLLEHFGFVCQCSMCAANGPSLLENAIVTTEFENLSAELGPMIFLRVKDANQWQAVKEKLFRFVKKRESMLPISKSIILASEFINMILTRELACQLSATNA